MISTAHQTTRALEAPPGTYGSSRKCPGTERSQGIVRAMSFEDDMPVADADGYIDSPPVSPKKKKQQQSAFVKVPVVTRANSSDGMPSLPFGGAPIKTTSRPTKRTPAPLALPNKTKARNFFKDFSNPPSGSNIRPRFDGQWILPFQEVAPELQELLKIPLFSKRTQWQLSPAKFQELTRDRLYHLVKTGAYRISKGPGMAMPGEEDDQGAFQRLLESLNFAGMYDMSLFDVIGVHAIGGNVVFIHGSEEQLTEHREKIDSVKEMYSCAASELSHGSNLKQIQTVAEYDSTTKKFTLHTPSETGSKYWIGNSTFVSHYVVVLSKIVVNGKEKGIGWLRVPLWKENSSSNNTIHKTRYPGVEVTDIGMKPGCNGIGNGCITFKNVKLPREALLSRFCQVAEDGTFTSNLTEAELFLRSIQTFVLERLGVATAAIGGAKACMYVALRYAAVRRQFGPDPSHEVPLISYPMHRTRLMTHIANLFGAKALIDAVGRNAEASFHPFTFDADRKSLHAQTCMVKAFGSWEAFAAAQEAREACGGHAFAATTQVGIIRNDLDVTLTFAGDNTLLALEVCRFRLKAVAGWPLSKKVLGPGKPFNWTISTADMKDPVTLLQKAVSALVYREETLLLSVGKKLQGDTQGQFERFTKASMEMKEAASAVYDRTVVMTWLELHTCRSELYDEIGMLQAMLRLQKNDSWYLTNGLMNVSTHKTIEEIIGTLCESLGKKNEKVLDALWVPPELVKDWPLSHADYSERLYDQTYQSPQPDPPVDEPTPPTPSRVRFTFAERIAALYYS
jgi:acyl-CoA oxidase